MVDFEFSARFEKYFVPLNLVNFLSFYALAFLSVHIKNTVFIIPFSPLTCNKQNYLNLVGGANCNKTGKNSGASCNGRENRQRSMDSMLVIAFDSLQMSKTKLRVAPYWIKVDILKQFPKYFSYLSFETVDV